MEKFDILQGISAPLPLVNVDTDMIIPKQFLKSPKRTGYGPALFYELRFNHDGTEKKEFILNREEYRNAKILVVGENFGCGSSREHAPWAISQFGIRCVIAPSFADIFETNCFKNSILPVRLAKAVVEEITNLIADPSRAVVTVNLKDQRIELSNGTHVPFTIDPYRKQHLMQGLDAIGVTLTYEKDISRYEVDHWFDNAWLDPLVIRASTDKEKNK